MASAAAVSADIDRPPIENDFDESNGVTSEIKTAQPEVDDDEDEDEDVQRKGRRQDRVRSNAEADDEDQGNVEDDDDLFGDGGDDEGLPEDPAPEYVAHFQCEDYPR